MESTHTADPAEVFASFRIFASDLDPRDVASKLGLAPDHSHRRGEPISGNPTFPYKHGMWSIDSKLPREASLAAHLEVLLSLLEPRLTHIKTVAARATVDFYCTLYSANGFQLSPDILARIAKLGASFGVVIYPDSGGTPMIAPTSSAE